MNCQGRYAWCRSWFDRLTTNGICNGAYIKNSIFILRHEYCNAHDGFLLTQESRIEAGQVIHNMGTACRAATL